MSETRPARIPSLVKKYLMAGSGLVLVLFVLGHMAGNLQIFSGSPATINRYARFLHSIPELLWLVRSFLFSCVIVHIWMAVLLTLENRAARPAQYAQAANIQTSFAARTMIWSGVIILAFILFHLAQFTLEIVNPMYAWLEYPLDGHQVHDVYAMVILGFADPAVAGFYILAVWLLCTHLSHGFSSMFQSLGVRNEKWRHRLDQAASAVGLVLFAGFAAVPASVQFSKYSDTQILPVQSILQQVDSQKWDPASPRPIGINYYDTPLAPAEDDSTPRVLQIAVPAHP